MTGGAGFNRPSQSEAYIRKTKVISRVSALDAAKRTITQPGRCTLDVVCLNLPGPDYLDLARGRCGSSLALWAHIADDNGTEYPTGSRATASGRLATLFQCAELA